MMTGMPVHFGSTFISSTIGKTSPPKILTSILTTLKTQLSTFDGSSPVTAKDKLFIGTQRNLDVGDTNIMIICTDNLDRFVPQGAVGIGLTKSDYSVTD